MVLSLAACGGGGSASGDPGQETGPCIDSACFSGLLCFSNLCVMPEGSGTSMGPGVGPTGVTDGDMSASSTMPPTSGVPTDPATMTNDPSEPTTAATTTNDPSDPGTTTTPGTSTDPDTSTTEPETTGGVVPPDTKWPPPDAMDPNMLCPENFQVASFVMGGAICAPKCSGPGKVCPSGDTGSALGQCLFNPDSSGLMCRMGDLCGDEKETCQMTGGGGMSCLEAPSHCVLLCNQGESCPAGMKCMGNLVCQYAT